MNTLSSIFISHYLFILVIKNVSKMSVIEISQRDKLIEMKHTKIRVFLN